MISVRGRFRGRVSGDHSYEFLRICHLVKYVWSFTNHMNSYKLATSSNMYELPWDWAGNALIKHGNPTCVCIFITPVMYMFMPFSRKFYSNQILLHFGKVFMLWQNELQQFLFFFNSVDLTAVLDSRYKWHLVFDSNANLCILEWLETHIQKRKTFFNVRLHQTPWG